MCRNSFKNLLMRSALFIFIYKLSVCNYVCVVILSSEVMYYNFRYLSAFCFWCDENYVISLWFKYSFWYVHGKIVCGGQVIPLSDCLFICLYVNPAGIAMTNHGSSKIGQVTLIFEILFKPHASSGSDYRKSSRQCGTRPVRIFVDVVRFTQQYMYLLASQYNVLLLGYAWNWQWLVLSPRTCQINVGKFGTFGFTSRTLQNSLRVLGIVT